LTRLAPGDPVPQFHCLGEGSPSFVYGNMAGRYTVLTFIGSASHPATRAVIASFRARSDVFDGHRVTHITLSNDPRDRKEHRIVDRPPGYLLLWDLDQKVSRQLGVIGGQPDARPTLTALSYIVDPSLHVAATLLITDPAHHADEVARALERLLAPAPVARPDEVTTGGVAPILLIPRVFEPELCQRLIDTFNRGAPEESGLMKSAPEGKDALVVDYGRKRRRDLQIADPELLEEVHSRMERRVVPELLKAFQFRCTRIERYVIACYHSASGGHFSAHRDNSGPATAHRRFACTINLNAEDYEGGNLSFAEYGPRLYRAPTGGAVVFSCSLMHEAHVVTRGDRYCLIPFLYDEEGERIRQEYLASPIDPALRRQFGAAFNHRVRA
jgi:peroxiredoxin/predicted 2-oxoglutarate/Fe(II)-dependent dioxygenase YbiX